MKGTVILLEELDCDTVQDGFQGYVFAFCIHILGICSCLDCGKWLVSFQTAESFCDDAVNMTSSGYVVQNVVCIS